MIARFKPHSRWTSTLGAGLLAALTMAAGAETPKFAPDYDAFTSSKVFDPAYYVATYPDLREAFGDDQEQATRHWVHHGIFEGRAGSPSFNSRYYLNRYADVATAYGQEDYVAAVEHWLTHGRKEGRRGVPDTKALTDPRVFDAEFYLETYPDLRQAFGDDHEAAKNHWLTHGIYEGRAASKTFNVRYYIQRNPEVKLQCGEENYIAAFEHWYEHYGQYGSE